MNRASRAGVIVAVGLLLLAILAASGYAVYFHHARRRPDFTLNDLHGRPRSAADFDGKVMVVNFWATWCRPCQAEIPMLVKAQKHYAKRGVQIIGIAIDRADAVRGFVKQHAIDYPVLIAPVQGARVQDAYAAGGQAPAGVLPYTAIVGRKGRVVARVAGALTRAHFDKLVQPQLTR